MNVDAYTNSHIYALYKYVMCMHCRVCLYEYVYVCMCTYMNMYLC